MRLAFIAVLPLALSFGAARAQPAAPDPDPHLKPNERYETGWRVTVFPKPARGQPADHVGGFIAKASGFTFGDFRRTVSHPGWASFVAGGWFKATERGRHVFTNRVSWEANPHMTASTQCQFKTSIDGQDVIAPENATFTAYQGNAQDRSFQGGIDLEQKLYPIAITISCATPNTQSMDEEYSQYARMKGWYDTIRFGFGLRGPNDMNVSPIADGEIYHVVKVAPIRAAPRRP